MVSPTGPFDPDGVTWTPVSPRLATARRVLLSAFTVPAVVAVLVLAFAMGQPLVAVVALVPVGLAVWGWWLIGRQVRAWCYAERDDDLLVRHGVMQRSLVVVPYGRMQYVDVQAGPLDRMVGIARLQLHTASAGTDAVIPGVPSDEAARLRDRLASRGEAQLAGL
jgi:uncharacterized protein